MCIVRGKGLCKETEEGQQEEVRRKEGLGAWAEGVSRSQMLLTGW